MIENTSEADILYLNLFEPNTGALKISKLCNFLQLQHPWPEYSFPQIDFMIFRNFNIYVSSAANLVNLKVYFRSNYEYGCACFSCLSKWLTGNIVGQALSSLL